VERSLGHIRLSTTEGCTNTMVKSAFYARALLSTKSSEQFQDE
jgi:hypothetical protein